LTGFFIGNTLLLESYRVFLRPKAAFEGPPMENSMKKEREKGLREAGPRWESGDPVGRGALFYQPPMVGGQLAEKDINDNR
jgi:hypothetical protein